MARDRGTGRSRSDIANTRAYYRRKLDQGLETGADEAVLRMLWAAHAIQSGHSDAGLRFFQSVPRDFVTSDMTDRHHIHPWEYETLANEMLTVPKRMKLHRGAERTLLTGDWRNVTNIVNRLRGLENIESAYRLNDATILREMSRIGGRQFDWQRGYFNAPQFYRSAYIYGQGACADFFAAEYGITVNQLSLIGYGLFVWLSDHDFFRRNTSMSEMGISPENLQRALALVTQPIAEARAQAGAIRRSIYHTAYRPSVFRMRPCISFGDEQERIRAPLPQLILERTTAGIFYDVVRGGGAVRDDYGHRFESYCLAYLRATLPGIDWQEEQRYRVKPNHIDTPDILGNTDGSLALAIECKASRMSYEARFGADPLEERGYEDIIKAVYQLWRFFSHCRRGLASFRLSDSVCGAVLTLDSWLLMAGELQAEVIERARIMAAEKDALILPEDQKPIAFFSITDMEASIIRATESSFGSAIRALATKEHHGWMLVNVHERFIEEGAEPKPFPFHDRLGEVLPWWNIIEDERDRRNQ